MAGQESLPGEIDELRDVKVIKSFYAGRQSCGLAWTLE